MSFVVRHGLCDVRAAWVCGEGERSWDGCRDMEELRYKYGAAARLWKSARVYSSTTMSTVRGCSHTVCFVIAHRFLTCLGHG